MFCVCALNIHLCIKATLTLVESYRVNQPRVLLAIMFGTGTWKVYAKLPQGFNTPDNFICIPRTLYSAFEDCATRNIDLLVDEGYLNGTTLKRSFRLWCGSVDVPNGNRQGILIDDERILSLGKPRQERSPKKIFFPEHNSEVFLKDVPFFPGRKTYPYIT